jgi:hypothetical protein
MANQSKEQVLLPQQQQPDVQPLAGAPAAPRVSTGAIGALGGMNDGAAATYQHSAKAFDAMSAQIGEYADKAAAAEGKEAGHAAGIDPEFRVKGDLTLYNRAYNEAGLSTYKNKLSVDLHNALADNFQKYPDDPAGLAATNEKTRAGFRDKLIPQALPEFESAYNRQALAHARDATRAMNARDKDEAVSGIQDATSLHLKTLSQNGLRLGLDKKADDVLAGGLADFSASLDSRGPDGQLLVKPQVKAKLLREAEDDITRSRITGTFMRLDGTAQKEAYIAEIEKKYLDGGDKLLNRFDPPHFEKLTAHLRSLARQDGAQDRAGLAALTKDINFVEKAAIEGVPVKDSHLQEMKGRLAVIGTPELIDKFNESANTLALIRTLNTQTPREIEAGNRELRVAIAADGTGRSEHRLDQLKKREAYLTKMHEATAHDPLGWAARSQFIKVPPLDLSSADGIANSLKARDAVAGVVAQQYNRPLIWLQPNEKAELAALARQGGKTLIDVAGGVVRALGDDNAQKFFYDVAQDMPEVATIGRMQLRGGDPQAALDAARNVERRYHDKTYVSVLKGEEKKIKPVLDGIVGRAFMGRPSEVDGLHKTANAIYETRAGRSGWTEFNEAGYKQAVNDVLGVRTVQGEQYGGLGKTGGNWLYGRRDIVVPPNVKTSGFDSLLGALLPADLADLGIPKTKDGKDLGLAEIRKGTAVYVGPGKYGIALDNIDSNPQWLMGGDRPDGRYVLDLNKVMPRLRERRRDLFLGTGLNARLGD